MTRYDYTDTVHTHTHTQMPCIMHTYTHTHIDTHASDVMYTILMTSADMRSVHRNTQEE